MIGWNRQNLLTIGENYYSIDCTKSSPFHKIKTRPTMNVIEFCLFFLFSEPLYCFVSTKTVNNETLSVFYWWLHNLYNLLSIKDVTWNLLFKTKTCFIVWEQTGRPRVAYIVKHRNTFWSACILYNGSRIEGNFLSFSISSRSSGVWSWHNVEKVRLCLQCVFHTKSWTLGNFRGDARPPLRTSNTPDAAHPFSLD